MKSREKIGPIQALILIGTLLTSVLITPSFSSEPVDLPKMFILSLVGFVILGLLFDLPRSLLLKSRTLLYSLVAFLCFMLTTLVFSGAPFNQQFFGTSGRNTGFLSYFALIIYMLAAALNVNHKFVKNLIYVLIFTGSANVLYGILQITKHDPIKWNNPYNPIIGFLGNPDFASAFIGLSSVAGVSFIFWNKINWFKKFLIAIVEVIALIIIVKSKAQQGVIVFLIGSFLVILIWIIKNKNVPKFILSFYLFLSTLVGAIVLMGIFKIGPLAQTLYKVSVRQRGFYWHAAIRMLNDKPLYGVGLDSYGDNYLAARSANAAKYSLTTQSNAAHNVFLDIASNGGYPLFLSYLAITFFALYRAIKAIREMEGFDPYFITLFAAWVGYQAQSVISINQLGLAVWGWVLGGTLIGFSYIGANNSVENSKRTRKARIVSGRNQGKYLIVALTSIIGIAMALPPLIADRNYRLAFATRDLNKVIVATRAYPEDTQRTLTAAEAIANSKLPEQALSLAKHVIEINPKNYNGWLLISRLSNPGSPDFLLATSKLKLQNPFDSSRK